MTISFRAARPDEAERLSEIACRSKAYWGYSPEQITAWRPDFLTLTADYITRHSPVVAEDDDCGVVAFAALERGAQGAVLEHLWVLPGFMGRGIGSYLFRRIAQGASEFTFTSDPQADGFYLKLGARIIGAVDSEHQGQTLSLFRYCRSDAKRAE